MVSARVLLVAVLLAKFVNGAEVVRLCDVLKNFDRYSGKEVVITAGFRVGFEWQALVCYDCTSIDTASSEKSQDPNRRVWVNLPLDVKGDSKLPNAKYFDQLEKVTFKGTFEGPGHYGHLNGYTYQFNVDEVKAALLVWSFNGKDAPVKVKSSVCR